MRRLPVRRAPRWLTGCRLLLRESRPLDRVGRAEMMRRGEEKSKCESSSHSMTMQQRTKQRELLSALMRRLSSCVASATVIVGASRVPLEAVRHFSKCIGDRGRMICGEAEP